MVKKVEYANKDIQRTISRIFLNRAKWEPKRLIRGLRSFSESYDQWFEKLASEEFYDCTRYYFLFHSRDLTDGLFTEPEYYFQFDNCEVLVSKFTMDDIYCVTYKQNL